MKRYDLWEIPAQIPGEDYNVIIVDREDEFDVYLEKKYYPMKFMFGVLKDQNTLDDAIELAKNNAPDYTYLFEEE